MKIAIIKYNAGNIRSVSFALSRLGYSSEVTDDFDFIRSADRVIFPGVGEASTTMNYIKEKGIDTLLRELTSPVLGICLGLQLMCRHSEEGDTPCLNIFDVAVKKFGPGGKIPHMGWNSLENMTGPLFSRLQAEPYVYFVHSYFAEISEFTVATCRYNNEFSASLQKDNYYATQFHPEKSGDPGHRILQNFINLK